MCIRDSRSSTLNAAALLRLLERCDALRKPQRFAQALQACQCDAQGRLGMADTPYPQAARLAQALELALAVATESVAARAISMGATGPKIGQFIHTARAQAIAAGLAETL